MIKADCHLHSNHSGDSSTPMEEMVKQGIALGLDTLCFTEHNDFDFPITESDPEGKFTLNPDSYLYELISLREKYANQITLLFGIELGLQPSCVMQNAVLAKSYDFDFIIGSSHLVNGEDPYYPAYYENRTEEEAYRYYFQSELENIKKFQNFDVYGHLDYVVRYGPNGDRAYTYDKYKDVIDPVLMALIEKEKGLEINIGGMKRGMREFHPVSDILRRYRELGGEIITIGSDAHAPEDMASHFDTAAEVLKSCGFSYYTVFEKRVPQFRKL